MLKRARMRRLIRQAHIPIPDFHVHLGPGPRYPDLTYYDEIVNTVYWQGPISSRDDERDFLHECGHVFDHHYLDDYDRARITPLVTPHPRPWFWDDRDPLARTRALDPVCEVFADAFAELCRSPRRRPQLRALVMQAYRDSLKAAA